MNNNQLYIANTLFWYKDSFKNIEIQKEYLKTLKHLAVELELEGLEKEIENYLLLLK